MHHNIIFLQVCNDCKFSGLIVTEKKNDPQIASLGINSHILISLEQGDILRNLYLRYYHVILYNNAELH